ncbi:hypothetical protein DOTSEDRAFT_44807 [Dothistroma septosporum NZE10]|uniref:Uncharacterized protein n=1 Tax=Dothistroma septosporum (strain NZE10 / CBS 128990) TaxID=675120 RepID=N1PQG1_DOTSN|nr:hypothetical protein DOTSEDRAFT_44807 [Dothistroma septosporum NZE10]
MCIWEPAALCLCRLSFAVCRWTCALCSGWREGCGLGGCKQQGAFVLGGPAAAV